MDLKFRKIKVKVKNVKTSLRNNSRIAVCVDSSFGGAEINPLLSVVQRMYRAVQSTLEMSKDSQLIEL